MASEEGEREIDAFENVSGVLYFHCWEMPNITLVEKLKLGGEMANDRLQVLL